MLEIGPNLKELLDSFDDNNTISNDSIQQTLALIIGAQCKHKWGDGKTYEHHEMRLMQRCNLCGLLRDV